MTAALLRPAAALAATVLLAACRDRQLVERVVAHECLGQPFAIRWFCDHHTDLALGINEGDFKDSNFGTRIHCADTGPGELSCFPDDVVFVAGSHGEARAYAGYLRWEHRLEVAPDRSRVRSVYHHLPTMGLLDRYVEPEFLAPMRGIEAELEVAHELVVDRPWVTTTVCFTNRAATAVRAHWLYQDGVFLHLPNQDQRRVTAVSSQGDARFVRVASGSAAWVGLADSTAGLASIVYAPTAAVCFVLPNYYGVRGSSFAAVGERVQGVPCVLAGNDRFWVHPEEQPQDLVPGAAPCEPVRADDLKIQGARFDFGEVAPGATQEIVFHRFGVTGATGSAAVTAAVQAILPRIVRTVPPTGR